MYALVGFFRMPVCESYALIQILPSFLVRKKVKASKVILEDILRNTREKQRGKCQGRRMHFAAFTQFHFKMPLVLGI